MNTKQHLYVIVLRKFDSSTFTQEINYSDFSTIKDDIANYQNMLGKDYKIIKYFLEQ